MCICPQLRLFPRSPTQWPPPNISNKRAIGARLASVMYTHAKYVVRLRVRHGESLLVVETKDNPAFGQANRSHTDKRFEKDR